MTEKEKNKSQDYFFIIINTNVTSLNYKVMELELYLRCNDWPHVVGVAETWFSELSVPNIAGYTLYRKDRESIHGHVYLWWSVYLCENRFKQF